MSSELSSEVFDGVGLVVRHPAPKHCRNDLFSGWASGSQSTTSGISLQQSGSGDTRGRTTKNSEVCGLDVVGMSA